MPAKGRNSTDKLKGRTRRPGVTNFKSATSMTGTAGKKNPKQQAAASAVKYKTGVRRGGKPVVSKPETKAAARSGQGKAYSDAKVRTMNRAAKAKAIRSDQGAFNSKPLKSSGVEQRSTLSSTDRLKSRVSKTKRGSQAKYSLAKFRTESAAARGAANRRKLTSFRGAAAGAVKPMNRHQGPFRP